MIRRPLLTVVVAVFAAAGCATIPGTPARSTGLTSTTGTAPTTSAPPSTEPMIAVPRRLENVDTCTLLRAADFADLGPFAHEPLRYERVPNSCVLQIGDGSRSDLIVMVSIGERFELFRAKNRSGYQLVVDPGHSAWVTCGLGRDRAMVCAEAFAVTEDRTLQVAMGLHDGNADQVAGLVMGRARAALDRLPAA